MSDTYIETFPVRITTSLDRDGTAVVEVAGEIDLACEEAIRAAIVGQLDRRPAALVVDLTEVDFFGSTGIQLLVDTIKHAQRLGVALAVATDRRTVLRPLEITLVDQTVDVYPTMREALTAVRAGLPHEPPSNRTNERSVPGPKSRISVKPTLS